MNIKIGKYHRYYTFFDFLTSIGFPNKVAEKLDDKYSDFFRPIFDFIYSFRKRKIRIRIDNYDVWNMDHTLSLIIHPMLVKLKNSKAGCPYTDMEDAPNIHDDFERWNYILDEMIFAHNYVISDWLDENGDYNKELQNRADNGLRLFGKYYSALWS